MPGAMRFLAFLSLVAADSWNEICNELLQPSTTLALTTTPDTVATTGGSTTPGTTGSTTPGTTTTTTTTTTSYEESMMPVFKERFRRKIKADGKLLVSELIFTLSSRVAAFFLGLLIGVPLLVFLCLRCSERCRRWSSYLDKLLNYRGRLGLILAVLLLAVMLSLLLTMQVLDSVQATIDEVKDYFVKSFVRRLLDDLLGQLAALKPWETGKKTQMFFTLCNPTEKPFVMHRLRASGYLLGADFFVATIDQPLHIPPRSVAELVVDLELQLGLVLPALGVAAGSWLSHRTSTFEQEVLEIHADIDTEISVRDSQAAFQMRINAPMLVRELPELTTLFRGETYEDPKKLLYKLYRALLGGLESRRFFEIRSLGVGGPLMSWVYLVVASCSAVFAPALGCLALLCVRGVKRCRRLRARGQESPELDSVVGRSLGFIELDIPMEQLQAKPHLTKSTSKGVKDHVQS